MNLASDCGVYAGKGIQLMHESLELLNLFVIDPVALVENNNGSKFDLIDKQIDDVPFVLIVDTKISIREIVEGFEVV